MRPKDLPASNHYASTDAPTLTREYEWLWSQTKVEGKFYLEAMRAAEIACKARARYQSVSNEVGVPWFFIAAIHYREMSQSWAGCLHNGDPWNEKTVHEPIGLGPWNSWEDAAVAALKREGYANLHDWGCGDVFRRLEFYNGKGYRAGGVKNFKCRKQGNRAGTFDGYYHGSMQDTTPRNASPYIYNGTPFYEKGVSIEDHSFYPDAVDDNAGAMLLLMAIELIGGAPLFPGGGAPAAPPQQDVSILETLQELAAQVSVPAVHVTRMFDFQTADRPGRFPRFWAACNFSKRSGEPRFFVLDRIGKTVTSHLCAHGIGSDGGAHDGSAVRFSNIPNSNESSLGIYRCAETYEGKHGFSLRIDGMEPSNANARHRDIVIHSADYVSALAVERDGHVGCSEGCFALSKEDSTPVVQSLSGGSLLIAFA